MASGFSALWWAACRTGVSQGSCYWIQDLLPDSRPCNSHLNSEMRVAHRLSAKLGRDVFVGGTSIESPHSFMAHVQDLGSMVRLALCSNSYKTACVLLFLSFICNFCTKLMQEHVALEIEHPAPGRFRISSQ